MGRMVVASQDVKVLPLPLDDSLGVACLAISAVCLGEESSQSWKASNAALQSLHRLGRYHSQTACLRSYLYTSLFPGPSVTREY